MREDGHDLVLVLVRVFLARDLVADGERAVLVELAIPLLHERALAVAPAPRVRLVLEEPAVAAGEERPPGPPVRPAEDLPGDLRLRHGSAEVVIRLDPRGDRVALDDRGGRLDLHLVLGLAVLLDAELGPRARPEVDRPHAERAAFLELHVSGERAVGVGRGLALPDLGAVGVADDELYGLALLREGVVARGAERADDRLPVDRVARPVDRAVGREVRHEGARAVSPPPRVGRRERAVAPGADLAVPVELAFPAAVLPRLADRLGLALLAAAVGRVDREARDRGAGPAVGGEDERPRRAPLHDERVRGDDDRHAEGDAERARHEGVDPGSLDAVDLDRLAASVLRPVDLPARDLRRGALGRRDEHRLERERLLAPLGLELVRVELVDLAGDLLRVGGAVAHPDVHAHARRVAGAPGPVGPEVEVALHEAEELPARLRGGVRVLVDDLLVEGPGLVGLPVLVV